MNMNKNITCIDFTTVSIIFYWPTRVGVS